MKYLMSYHKVVLESTSIYEIYISFLHTHLQVWRVDNSTRIVILMNCRNNEQNQICWKIVTIHELSSSCSFSCVSCVVGAIKMRTLIIIEDGSQGDFFLLIDMSA